MTRRVRDGSGNIITLDLTQAAAASRRLDIPSTHRPPNGKKLIGFFWTCTTNQAKDVSIYSLDGADNDKARLIEKISGDTKLDGSWTPASPMAAGPDYDKPQDAVSLGWRIEFGQTGGACAASPIAQWEE